MSLRNKPSQDSREGLFKTTPHMHTHISAFSQSKQYSTYPSSNLSKHLCTLIVMARRKQVTNEVTSWSSGDIDASENVYSQQVARRECCAAYDKCCRAVPAGVRTLAQVGSEEPVPPPTAGQRAAVGSQEELVPARLASC